MKKQLVILALSIISFGIFSQSTTYWQPHGSGLDSTWGIRYLSAVDSNTVWAIGFHKSAYSATNIFTKTGNGAHFTASTFLPDTNTYSASSICALDSNTAFISIFDKDAVDTSRGKILMTTNGGINWANIASTGIDSMFVGVNNFPDFVYFWDINNGIAVGDPNGHTIYNDSIQIAHGDTIPQFEIWQTTNGGTNWMRVSDTLIPSPQTNEYGQSNSYAVYKQKVWFGTSMGRVYISSDTGRWDAKPTGLYGGVIGLAFRDSLHGIAWGFINATTNNITIMNTANGGLTWTALSSNPALGTADFCAIPGTYAYMSVGLNEASSLYATSISYSDGESWNTLESNTLNTEKMSVIQMTDTLHGWAGAYTTNGTVNGINKYIGNNLAGIQQVTATNNQVTIYPNPSNGYITLSLINVATTTQLSVCDMLGNEVYTTTIKGSAANQNLNIDLSTMQKGMYMLKMQNSSNTNQVQKLIIQ